MTTASFEAVLIAGATQTTYRRAGAGKPVLLLFPGGLDEPFAALVFAHLAASVRVVAPVLPQTVRATAEPAQFELAFATWLRDLIDGLGLPQTILVADEPVACAALAFVQGEPERVRALIVARRTVAEDVAAAALIVVHEVHEQLRGLEHSPAE